ncbi:uncharacterized protein LOC124530778 [Vanessa cardui]|uniref:uncharacterized protein LOC124530778 n=1 Tax=Vanessa cardui TaxID=171605 RepID=UPI001F142A41|nr:uncharacterized protein LOC124530778 [Vanessa cardui]
MTTVQFEYDPERLIEEVKKRPGIWDFENLEYRTKNLRHKLWTEVVNELMTSDVKVSKSEMRELELQLQKKWKSIRDCFQKYVSHPNRTRRPYLYSKQLQFLLKKRIEQPETASSESDDGRNKRRAWRPKKKLKLTKESSEEDNDNDNNDDYQLNEDISIDVPQKHNIINKSNVIDEFAFANVDSQVRSELEDPDKLFLLSLLPHFKSIPEEMRLNVKMDMMQVLRNANYHTAIEHKII